MHSPTVGVVIATFGCLTDWAKLIQRALVSLQGQTVPPTRALAVHGETLAVARNAGAVAVGTDHLIFLDADDELDSGYIETMLATGEGDLRWPRVQYIRNNVPAPPQRLQPSSGTLLESNWMVIGSMVRRELFLRVGGFRELDFWEDWDLWLRCWVDGAKIVEVPKAIYKAHVRPDSRNHVPAEIGFPVYEEIRQRYRPLAVERGYVHK